MKHDDSMLIQAWTEVGDRDAFRVLYERHFEHVYSFAHALSGRHEDAIDAAQETFLLATTKLAQFGGAAKLSTWLLSITRNVVNDQGRRQKKRDRDAERAPPVNNAPPSPDAKGLADERRAAVRSAIAELPERQRLAVILCHMEGVPVAEAATVLDEPEGTVKSHLHRARSTLKETLSEYMDD